MNDKLALAPKPEDTTTRRINIRKAMAGIYLLQGVGSEAKCLVKAGFSRKTAHTPKGSGLSASACIAEARKLDVNANPANMLATARARAMLVIEGVGADAPLKDAMKMLEVTEKYYGGHELRPVDAIVGLADRLAQMAALLTIGQRRGLPVPTLEADTAIEAEVVATGPERVRSDNVVRDVTPDGTTR